MRTCFSLPALKAALAVAVLVLAAGFAGGAARAETANGANADLVLSKLPAKDSTDYKALADTAGAHATQSLDMTGSEMWSVPRDRLDAFLKAAAGRGVEVTRLDDPAANQVHAMPADTKMSETQEEMMHKSMESKAAMGMTMMHLPKPAVMEYMLTKGMNEPEAGAPPSLVIPLTHDKTVTAHRTGITKSGDGYIWRGLIDGSGEPVTLLWWPDGRVSGTVTHAGRMYVIKSLGGGMHGMLEIAPDKLPPDHGPAPKAMMQKMDMKQDPLVRDGDASMLQPGPKPSDVVPVPEQKGAKHAGQDKDKDAEITIIVAYTKKAASHWVDIKRELIDVAVAEANQSFKDSGAGNVHLKLVDAYETNYAEKGSHFDHVYRFRNKGDGYMDEIHDLRDKYGADVAALIVDDPMGCGLSIRVGADAPDAFTVIDQSCAASMYSLAHEIGHLIGARHDRFTDDTERPFAYGHGYLNGKSWRTMMSYKDGCDGCPRRPVWSGPEVKVDGVPAGDATTDNAKVVREEAARLTTFRPKRTSAAAP